jgi:hypothetical protein
LPARRLSSGQSDLLGEVHPLAKLDIRGTAILRAFAILTEADRDDVIARTRDRLLCTIRRSGIRGSSDGEIDHYISKTLRHQALNFIRTRARHREAGALNVRDVAGEQLSQEEHAIMSEQLCRARSLILSFAKISFHSVDEGPCSSAMRQPRENGCVKRAEGGEGRHGGDHLLTIVATKPLNPAVFRRRADNGDEVRRGAESQRCARPRAFALLAEKGCCCGGPDAGAWRCSTRGICAADVGDAVP